MARGAMADDQVRTASTGGYQLCDRATQVALLG
jgi:hypothetical protein